jgi:hypothetical protein
MHQPFPIFFIALKKGSFWWPIGFIQSPFRIIVLHNLADPQPAKIALDSNFVL